MVAIPNYKMIVVLDYTAVAVRGESSAAVEN